MPLPYKDFYLSGMLSLSILIIAAWWINQHILLWCLYQLFRLPNTPTSAILIYSTRSRFLLIFIAVLPRIFTLIDDMLYTALASHMHAPTLTHRPIYPPLVCTLSFSANTNNIKDSHNARGFIPPNILHYNLVI